MDQQTVDTKHAISNGFADLAADECHRIFERLALKEVAAGLAAKQRAYCKLLAAIHRCVARVQATAARRRDEAAAGMAGTASVTTEPPAPPTYGDFYEAHSLFLAEYPLGSLAEADKRQRQDLLGKP